MKLQKLERISAQAALYELALGGIVIEESYSVCASGPVTHYTAIRFLPSEDSEFAGSFQFASFVKAKGYDYLIPASPWEDFEIGKISSEEPLFRTITGIVDFARDK